MLDAKAKAWNCSLTVGFRKGNVSVEVVAGLQDPAGTAPLTPAMLVPLGSTTKPFTVVGVLRLVEQGRFGLDDPVGPLIDPALTTWNGTTWLELWDGDTAAWVP